MYDVPMTSPRKLKTLDDLPLDGKRVLVRVDFNVPAGADSRIDKYEDYRLVAAIPTIDELRQRRAKVILLTHLGRSQEQVGNVSLAAVHSRLEELLGEEVKQSRKLTGSEAEAIIGSLEPGGVVLLPNVRLDEREELGNQKFAHELADLAEIYVNEAFSVCHRAHASVAVLPTLLPACAGRRTVQEVTVLNKLRTAPAHPYVAIVSGAKISTKIGLLHRLLSRVDTLCLGGQLANVFLAAAGHYAPVHFHPDEVATAKSLIEQAADKIIIPTDVIIGGPHGEDATAVPTTALPDTSSSVYDIGPATTAAYIKRCQAAKTIMWNGPLGKFEIPVYAASTQALAASLAIHAAYRVIGGGDTAIAIAQQRLTARFDHVSIGGGAMVAFLEDKRMPGLEPLYSTKP